LVIELRLRLSEYKLFALVSFAMACLSESV